MAGTRRSTHDQAETRRHLEGYLEAYPGLRGRVCRILLLHLHTHGHVRIEDVYRRAQRAEGWNVPTDPNRPSARLWAADEKEVINGIVTDLAAEYLSPKEVDNIVWAAHRRDEAQSLQTLARMPDIPLELVVEKVSQYASLPSVGTDADTPEGTKVALLRRFVSNRVDYIAVGKRYLRIRDLSWILDRVVCTEQGNGLVGGKAAGMVLAGAILRAGGCPVELPETVFLLTDAYDEFKLLNGLSHLEDHKYKAIEEVRADFRAIGEVFHNAEFPPRVSDLLRLELDRRGELPLIVRSSSLLEDSFGATFSGIYRSIFLANQGPLEDRLRELQVAIAEIYSSVFSPDAISYRRRHDLLDYDERMGIMIQPVVGSRYDDYFLPTVAGVAFSRNDYRWNARIAREDGLARLVVGLGTHAVDRVGDFARMVPLKTPTMRPEGTPEEIVQASQKQADVVDLNGAGFANVPVGRVLEAMRAKGIADYVSIIGEDGGLSTPVGTRITEPVDALCVTFDRLLTRGDFPKRLRKILKTLEAAYKTPVDVEFAVDKEELHVVQCRPLGGELSQARTPVPSGIPGSDKIFSARRYVNNGQLEGIEYVVLIDPRDYGELETINRRLDVARTVGQLNDALADRVFLLMGPGRWGSQDIRLGVPVTYADICNARALVEIARSSEGYTPEPSFGTHFFQDLIEDGISYLPLYPDDEGSIFNEEFLRNGVNTLARHCPGYAHMADVVRVIDVEESRPGQRLNLAMDGELQEALCYLASSYQAED
ncbi:MAG: PEP/pyruvate-binding domain-containing protein [Planctomycetota bacterium]|jgi:hypothetical protein